MATRTRPPARRRGRGGLDALAGLAAIAALLALLAGVPLVLISVFGLPVPHGMPSASLFTHRLQPSAVLKACSVVVWLAWLQFVWCVIAEVSAAVRNTGMPARVPLAGGMQALAHRLVATALLLSAASALAPALAPVAASAATRPAAAGAVTTSAVSGNALAPVPAGPPSANGAPRSPGAGYAAAPAQPPTAAAPNGNGAMAGHVTLDAGQAGGWAQRTEKIYVVKPPVGRFHESLWEIAQNHLGDGRRYREIFELNAGRRQPDGSKLTIASLIRPGWILRMPHDAHGPGIEVVTASPHGRHTHERPARPHQRPGAEHQAPPPPTARTTAPTPEASTPAARPATPAPRATAPATPRPRATGPATPAPKAAPGHAGSHQGAPAHAAHPASRAYPLELAGAGLLAAGVLVALERRRRRQARRRPYRKQVVAPAPDAAWAELALQLGADEAAAQLLDTGLRYLGFALGQEGRTPPTVFAVHVGEENLDLWVSPASQDAPQPWYPVGDGQVWRLALADAPHLDLGEVHAPAPYPGLVSIGTDATGRVLVDLEAAHGVVAVTGPGDLVADALAAMATELATSFWSDQMHITLVGVGEDLEVLAPDRVHLVASVAEALPVLETHAAAVAEALASSDADSAPGGRVLGVHPGVWLPHYLVSAIPPTDAERERLLALARTVHSPAAGYLVAGAVPGATWTWEVTPDGRLRAPQLGLDVEAQLIPHEQQVAMAELFDSADELDGALMSAPPVDLAPDSHLLPGAVAPVEVTLLGEVSVAAAGEIEPGRLGLATELVVYLAAHPGGVHPNVLTAALWPRGVTEEVRDATLARVQAWLGNDGIGRPHLAADASGRLRLGSGVRVDWHVFLTLIAQAGQAAALAGTPGVTGTKATELEEATLAQALSLVTGPFLAGRERGRYTWLVADGLEYEVSARVADAAHRLCELRLADGDPRAAMDAAQAGLRLASDDELLWRDLLTAADATGQDHLLRAAAAEVWARAARDGAPPDLAPQTEALLDELMPTWRWTLA